MKPERSQRLVDNEGKSAPVPEQVEAEANCGRGTPASTRAEEANGRTSRLRSGTRADA